MIAGLWRNFSEASFEEDLAASKLCGDLESLVELSVDDLAELYNNEMQSLLDTLKCVCAGKPAS